MDSVNPQAPPLSYTLGLGVKFYRYRNLVLRHWWILFLTVSCGLAYEGYKLYTKPQLFESKSDLFVREELIQQDGGGKNFIDLTGQMLQTAAEQFKNPVVLEGAKDQLALTSPGLQGDSAITSAIVPKTNILTITSTGTNPEYSQKYLSEVIDSFMKMRDEVRKRTFGDVSGNITDTILETKKELSVAKTKLQSFIEQNNMAFWAEQGKAAATYLNGLKNQQANLKNQLQRLQNLTPDQLLETSVGHGQPAQGEDVSSAGRSEGSFNSELYTQFTQVTQQLIQKQAELAQWKTVWKPKHPKLQRIESQVEDLERLLGIIKKQNAEATSSQIAAMTAELKSLDSSIQVWTPSFTEASRKDGEYQTLQSDVARAQSQLEKLTGDLKGIGTGKNVGTDPLVVMRRATPAIPVPARALKQMLLGLMGGLIVGAAFWPCWIGPTIALRLPRKCSSISRSRFSARFKRVRKPRRNRFAAAAGRGRTLLLRRGVPQLAIVAHFHAESGRIEKHPHYERDSQRRQIDDRQQSRRHHGRRRRACAAGGRRPAPWRPGAAF